MDGKYKKLLSDTFLFTLSNFASKAISFLLIPLYTRILTTADYGISDLIQTLVNFLYPFLTLSISEATIRFAFDKKEKKEGVLSTSLSIIVLGWLLLVLTTPLVYVFNIELSKYWLFFLAYYLTYNIHYCFSQYTRGCDKVRLFAIQGIVHTAIVILSNIILLLGLKMGVVGYLISFIIGYVFSTLHMIIGGRFAKDIFHFKFDKVLFKEMLKYSVPMIPTQVFWWINNAADKWVIIAFKGVAENGIYSVAHKIPTILTMVTSIFNQAWQVSAFNNYKQKDNDAFISNVYSVFTFMNLLICTLLITGSELIGTVLFAEEFLPGWVFVPPLLIAAVFNGISGMLASVFTSEKKTNKLFISTGVGAVLNLVLNVPFVMRFGAIGAAYATAISCIAVWFTRIIQAGKYVKIKANYVLQIISFVIIALQAVLTANQKGDSFVIGAVALLIILLCNIAEIKKMSSTFIGFTKNIFKKKGK